MTFETLGDWCKWLEKNFSPEIMIPTLPAIIRLDGNNFHTWTKGLERPFCEPLTNLMVATTKHLVEYTNAVIGYTQSDEITLLLFTHDRKSDIFNAGKKQKILSKVAASCSNFFNEHQEDFMDRPYKTAMFDARIYQCPSLSDARAQLTWRENDAVKNSISSCAQSMFSHKELHGKNKDQMQYMMITEQDFNWNDIEPKFKRGTYIQRQKVNRKLTDEELRDLPEKHEARKNPDLGFERSILKASHELAPLHLLSARI